MSQDDGSMCQKNAIELFKNSIELLKNTIELFKKIYEKNVNLRHLLQSRCYNNDDKNVKKKLILHSCFMVILEYTL